MTEFVSHPKEAMRVLSILPQDVFASSTGQTLPTFRSFVDAYKFALLAPKVPSDEASTVHPCNLNCNCNLAVLDYAQSRMNHSSCLDRSDSPTAYYYSESKFGYAIYAQPHKVIDPHRPNLYRFDSNIHRKLLVSSLKYSLDILCRHNALVSFLYYNFPDVLAQRSRHGSTLIWPYATIFFCLLSLILLCSDAFSSFALCLDVLYFFYSYTSLLTLVFCRCRSSSVVYEHQGISDMLDEGVKRTTELLYQMALFYKCPLLFECGPSRADYALFPHSS